MTALFSLAAIPLWACLASLLGLAWLLVSILAEFDEVDDTPGKHHRYTPDPETVTVHR